MIIVNRRNRTLADAFSQGLIMYEMAASMYKKPW